MESLIQQRPDVAVGTTYTIDPVHSAIYFSIKHMAFSIVHGRFGGFRGAIRFDGDFPRDVFVEAEIDVATIDTGEPKRDAHLRSADFFDVAAYPTITFRSTRIEPAAALRRDRWTVIGNLTLHGVTRSVALAVEQIGDDPDPELWDVETASFSATTKIKRKDFSIGLSPLFNVGGLAMGDDVTIAIDVEVVEGPGGGQ
jgi:polyisoprenoid-binding protein YceI